MTNNESFWNWVNQEMEARGLSFYSLEKQAGLSNAAISRQARQWSRPTNGACVAIAKVFGLPLEHVLRLAGHLPPLLNAADLSPEAQADLDQIRRYVAMLSPEAQARLTEQLVGITKTMVDLSKSTADAA